MHTGHGYVMYGHSKGPWSRCYSFSADSCRLCRETNTVVVTVTMAVSVTVTVYAMQF